jgi:hypothetical protein
MHHHLFPTEDTSITNQSGREDKNFGINEILRIGTSNQSVRSLQTTKEYTYTNVTWTNYCVTDFTGTLSGSFVGAGTASGWINSSASLSASYFSGSLDGGVISEQSGWFSGSLVGTITGSILSTNMSNYSGNLSSSYGHITGVVTGTDTRNENYWATTATKFVDRTLMKFDVDEISRSISSGEITDPKFKLNLKVCGEYELPISYKIYAFPVSQSWVMGNGYYADGGSDNGASWYYRDYADGTAWYPPITSSLRPVVDFLNNPANATASFAYGGGTWTYMSATQSFSYESADVCMDVTDIVMSWISGTFPNEGFILMSSDEIVSSGSGFALTFYGKDTNSINSPYLDVMWSDWTWSTGSTGISSVTTTSSYSGMQVTSQTGSTFSIAGGINGIFSSSIVFTTLVPIDGFTSSFTGIVVGTGLTGNIAGLPIVGGSGGIITTNTSSVTGPCGATFDAQIVTASFTDGVFSGSTFTAYYTDHKLENAHLTGSWSTSAILGSQVTIPIPSGVDPYAYAYVTGKYISGTALGTYMISGSVSGGVGSNSASFSGQFIDGPLIGGELNLQLSGSVFTSSYFYTSSIEVTSSVFTPLDTDQSFTVIIKNLKPEYKGGDVVRIQVFGRKEFPLKTYEKTSQQLGYIVPELLPTSSYYAIKDNMSEEIIVDFDNYTRISGEYPDGNFFMLDTSGLAQERPYRILIRIQDGSSIYTFDNNDVLKIIR